MPKSGVVPTCRYDHGPLWKVEGRGYPRRFLLSGEEPRAHRDGDGRLFDLEFRGILVSAWECQFCGYTELFEADMEENDGPPV